MSVLHRQSSGSQIPATFAALEEECFRQLDSRYTTDIYPAMLQLLSCMSSHCIFCWFYASCAFGTAATNSTILLLTQAFLCVKDSPGSSCWPLTSPRFAADSQRCFTGADNITKTTSLFYLLAEGGAKSQWNSLLWRANTTQKNLPTT